jgi:hypothetical protein
MRWPLATLALVGWAGCTSGVPMDDASCIATPADFDFGAVSASNTVTRLLSLRNPTARTLTIDVGDPAPPFSVVSGRFTMVPRQSLDLQLTVSADGRSAVSRVPFKGGDGCPQEGFGVQLRGTGVVVATPVQLDFGAVPIGSERTLEVVIASSRTNRVVFDQFDVIDMITAGGVFSVSRVPFTLDPNGGTHVFPVTVSAQASGSIDSVLTLQGQDQSLGEPVLLSLTLRAHGGGPVVDLSPLAIDASVPFFPAAPESSFVVRHLSLSNVGDETDVSGALQVTDVQLETLEGNAGELCVGEWDAGCMRFSTPPQGIAAGASIEVPLRLMAKTAGPRRWRVRVKTNDVVTPEQVVMVEANTFEPEPCALSIRSPVFDAGLDPRLPAVASLVLVNSGPSDCLVDDVHARLLVTRSTSLALSFPDAGSITLAEGPQRVDAGATLSLPVVVRSGVPNSTVEGFVSLHPLRADGGVVRFPLSLGFR